MVMPLKLLQLVGILCLAKEDTAAYYISCIGCEAPSSFVAGQSVVSGFVALYLLFLPGQGDKILLWLIDHGCISVASSSTYRTAVVE